MKKLLAGIMLSAIIPIAAQAQKVEVVTANEQSWSGGIAGHYGTNYDISIRVTGGEIDIDSVYINSTGYAVTATKVADKNPKTHKVQNMYKVNIQDSHYEDADGNIPPVAKKDKANLQHRSYNGTGLITYKLKGEKHLLIIKTINELPAIAYP